jgi:hypothetical protein
LQARSKLQGQNNIEELLDPRLPGCAPKFDDLNKALAVAWMCTMTDDVDRPEIGEIVQDLRCLADSFSDNKGSLSSAA